MSNLPLPSLPRLPRLPSASRPPTTTASPAIETPLLCPVSWDAKGFLTGNPIYFSSLLSPTGTTCVVSLAEAYEPSMDIHHVTEAHDMVVRHVTRQIVLLVRPGSPRPGNSPWHVNESVRRLAKVGILSVHAPSDALVAFLGIDDGRQGLRNALLRFDEGRLTRSWRADGSNLAEPHRAGLRDVTTPRGK